MLFLEKNKTNRQLWNRIQQSGIRWWWPLRRERMENTRQRNIRRHLHPVLERRPRDRDGRDCAQPSGRLQSRTGYDPTLRAFHKNFDANFVDFATSRWVDDGRHGGDGRPAGGGDDDDA